jgi:hypothetical protein
VADRPTNRYVGLDSLDAMHFRHQRCRITAVGCDESQLRLTDVKPARSEVSIANAAPIDQ